MVVNAEIQGIQQARYRIIYSHPEAFRSGKLRKVLDSDMVRETLRAVVVDEADLIEEWQVDSCFLIVTFIYLF